MDHSVDSMNEWVHVYLKPPVTELLLVLDLYPRAKHTQLHTGVNQRTEKYWKRSDAE